MFILTLRCKVNEESAQQVCMPNCYWRLSSRLLLTKSDYRRKKNLGLKYIIRFNLKLYAAPIL